MQDFLTELWQFFTAVFSQWIALVTGIIFYFISYYEHKQGEQLKSSTFYKISILCVYVAVFLAWREEHIELRKHQEHGTQTLLTRRMIDETALRVAASDKDLIARINQTGLVLEFSCDSAAKTFADDFYMLMQTTNIFVQRNILCNRDIEAPGTGLFMALPDPSNMTPEASKLLRFLLESGIPISPKPIKITTQDAIKSKDTIGFVYIGK